MGHSAMPRTPALIFAAVSLLLVGVVTSPAAGLQLDSVQLALAQLERLAASESFPQLESMGTILLETQIPSINRESRGDIEVTMLAGCSRGEQSSPGDHEAPRGGAEAGCPPHFWIVVQYFHEGRNTILFARLEDVREDGSLHRIEPVETNDTLWSTDIEEIASKIIEELYRLKGRRIRIERGTKRIALGLFESQAPVGHELRGSIPNELGRRLNGILEDQAHFSGPPMEVPADLHDPTARAAYDDFDGILRGSYTINGEWVDIRYQVFSLHRNQAILENSQRGTIRDLPVVFDQVASEIAHAWTRRIDNLLSPQRE